jgi:PAS domain S-box-containing protein
MTKNTIGKIIMISITAVLVFVSASVLRFGDIILAMDFKSEIVAAFLTLVVVIGVFYVLKWKDQRADIAEQKKKVEELKISEEKYRLIVESTQDSIYLVDRDCKYLFINSKHKSRLGIEDYLGYSYADYHSEQETRDFSEKINRVFEKGESMEHEYEHGGKWFHQTLSPVRDPRTGKVTAVSAIHVVSIEITARKDAEKKILENERIASATRAKSEFLANMSHELRTPLNSIIGFSELLKWKPQGVNMEKQEHYIDNILFSSKHLLAIINDILDLSNVEAGNMELVIDKTSVPETVNDIISLVKDNTTNCNIVMKTELDADLEFIHTDKEKFIQILFNLISNAVKFSKQEEGIVTITSKKEGDIAEFSVSDTGIGIKKEDMGRLFKTFEQLDSSITKNYSGTGLGLAVSKKLVELLGGRISAESKYGGGSTFTFTLPIKVKKL